jgi:hypothetical protein
MSDMRSSGYPLMNITEDGVHRVISLYRLVDSWVWRSWTLIIFLVPHLELVEMLALRKMVDLVLMEALWIP